MSHLRTLSLPAMVQSVGYFEAAKTAGQAIAGATATKMTFDAATTNNLGITVSANVFTFVQSGLYLLLTGFQHAGVYGNCQCKKNGSMYYVGPVVGSSQLRQGLAVPFNILAWLAAGDTVEFEAVDYNAGGVTIASNAQSALRIIRL